LSLRSKRGFDLIAGIVRPLRVKAFLPVLVKIVYLRGLEQIAYRHVDLVQNKRPARAGAFSYLLMPEPGPVGAAGLPLGELGSAALPDGFMGLEVLTEPAVPLPGTAPVVVPAVLPAGGGVPTLGAPVCASAKVPDDSANAVAVANAKVMIFMFVSCG
jgi:hypothetical protein